MTGQRLGQAGWLSPFASNRKEAALEAGFTSSSGGVRAPSVTRSRNCAVRSDEKPYRAESTYPRRVSSLDESQLPRGFPVATVHQHGRTTLAASQRPAK